MNDNITVSKTKLMCISDMIAQLEYIKSQYGDIPVRIARAEYRRCSEGDSISGRINTFDANAITGPQWISNTAFQASNDIDYTVHNNTMYGDYLELS